MNWIPAAICCASLTCVILALAVCLSAKRGDEIMADALHELDKPAPPPADNRRAHRLGRLMAVHHTLK